MGVRTSLIPVKDHGSLQGLADDDHTQYQPESEKGSANGYAGLNASGKVPADQNSRYDQLLRELSASDDLLGSDDTEDTGSETDWTKVKELTLFGEGELRIKFDLKAVIGGTAYGKIYRNGSPVGTEQSETSTNYVTKSEDIAGWSNGDTIELWCKHGTGGGASYGVQNFRVYGAITEPTMVS